MATRTLRYISWACWGLLIVLGFDILHRIGIIRLLLLICLVAVGFITSTIAHFYAEKGA